MQLVSSSAWASGRDVGKVFVDGTGCWSHQWCKFWILNIVIKGERMKEGITESNTRCLRCRTRLMFLHLPLFPSSFASLSYRYQCKNELVLWRFRRRYVMTFVFKDFRLFSIFSKSEVWHDQGYNVCSFGLAWLAVTIILMITWAQMFAADYFCFHIYL